MTTTVYGLHNGDGEIRYIGITIMRPQQRLNAHLSAARSGVQHRPVLLWIKKHDYRITLEELLVVCDSRAGKYEIAAISSALSSGVRLLNVDGGGRGGAKGREWSQSQRIAQSIRLSGVPRTEETKAKISSAAKGRDMSRARALAATKRSIPVTISWSDRESQSFSSVTAAADHVGVSKRTMLNWVAGKYHPRWPNHTITSISTS